MNVHWQWKLAGALTAARVATLGWSSYPVHQGYGEVLYTKIATGATTFPQGLKLLPMRYLPIKASFAVLGESEAAARLPGMVAFILTAILAVGIGRSIAGEFGSKWAPLFFTANPWTLSWYGRAMPDAWLALGLVSAAFFALKSNEDKWYALGVGPSILLACAAKPTGILALLALFLMRDRHAFLLTLASSGLAALAFANIATRGHPFDLPLKLVVLVAHRGHVEERFHDVPGMLAAMVLGLGLIGFAAWASRDLNQHFVLAGLTFYPLWDALPNHGYYALPLATWASIFAVGAIQHYQAWAPWALAVSLVLAGFALAATGNLGDNRTRISQAYPGNVTVNAPGHLIPMLDYYNPNVKLVHNNHTTPYRISFIEDPGCRTLQSRSYLGESLYAQTCPVPLPSNVGEGT